MNIRSGSASLLRANGIGTTQKLWHDPRAFNSIYHYPLSVRLNSYLNFPLAIVSVEILVKSYMHRASS